MTSKDELAALLNDILDRVGRLETGSQLSSSTVGDDADAAAVGDVVVDSAVTNLAVPGMQEDTADSNQGIIDLQNMLSAVSDDLDARFDGAAVDLDLAREEIAESQQAIEDAFGVRFDGMSDDIQTAIRAAGAAQDTADGIPLILFSTTRGPSNGSDLAPTGSTWFLVNAADNIAGQWQQTGPAASPTWTPRAIISDVIANLDVGKLTAGSAAIADLVAQKIAASTANFQTVNVSNLFVTQGATMNQATIDYLFANIVQAKKITASMIDVSTLNGVTITGAVLQTSATGKRVVMSNNRLNFYGLSGTTAVNAGVIEGVPNGAAGGLLSFGPGTGDSRLLVGTQALPTSGSADVRVPGVLWIGGLYLDGDVTATNLPWRMAVGQTQRSANIANGASTGVDITFPSGRFAVAPRVFATAQNSRITVGVTNVTKDGCTITVANWSGASTTAPFLIDWMVMQMTSSAANG